MLWEHRGRDNAQKIIQYRKNKMFPKENFEDWEEKINHVADETAGAILFNKYIKLCLFLQFTE